jgi:hypothetical protein
MGHPVNVRLTLWIYLIREVFPDDFFIKQFHGTIAAIICFDSLLAHTVTCKDAKTCSLAILGKRF